MLRRKQEEAARLRDPSLFPSLGGKKMEPKKKTGDIWQLDSVHISEAELEAARPPKLEGEGDEGLGLKVVLQPGSRIVDDGEELDKILKNIAGVSVLCVVLIPRASFIVGQQLSTLPLFMPTPHSLDTRPAAYAGGELVGGRFACLLSDPLAVVGHSALPCRRIRASWGLN